MTSIAVCWAVGTPQPSDWLLVCNINIFFKGQECISTGRNLKRKANKK